MVLANLWHQQWKAKDAIAVAQNGAGCCFALAFKVVYVQGRKYKEGSRRK